MQLETRTSYVLTLDETEFGSLVQLLKKINDMFEDDTDYKDIWGLATIMLGKMEDAEKEAGE